MMCLLLTSVTLRGIYLKHFPFSTCRHRFDGKQKRSTWFSCVREPSIMEFVEFRNIMWSIWLLTHGYWFSWNKNMQLEDGKFLFWIGFWSMSSKCQMHEIWKHEATYKVPGRSSHFSFLSAKNFKIHLTTNEAHPYHPLYTGATSLKRPTNPWAHSKHQKLRSTRLFISKSSIRKVVTAMQQNWWRVLQANDCRTLEFHKVAGRLQLQLGAAPVTSLGVVSDLVARAHSDPLGDGTILLKLLGKLELDSQCLVRWHFRS